MATHRAVQKHKKIRNHFIISVLRINSVTSTGCFSFESPPENTKSAPPVGVAFFHFPTKLQASLASL